MSTLIVDVCKVDSIENHSGADTLEILKVKAWTVIAKKGLYKVGQKCVYIPPDTVLSGELADKLGVTKYLHPLEKDEKGIRPPGGRIRVASLRGVRSYGMVMECENPDWEVGYSVVDHYGFQKWEPTIRTEDADAEKPHPAFFRYTDIEHYQNFPEVIAGKDNLAKIISFTINIIKDIIMSGFIHKDASVLMSDFRSEKISNFLNQDLSKLEILGADLKGSVIPTSIKNIHKTEKISDWIILNGTRKGAGCGNYYFKLICNNKHKIWSCGKYIDSENLKEFSEIEIVRNNPIITPLQEQILLGKMLGDGTFVCGEYSAGIHFGHKVDHIDYIEWTMSALSYLSNHTRAKRISGYGTHMIAVHTVHSWFIKEEFSSFIKNGKKIVPDWVANKLGPIAIAFWYMDDGSLSTHKDQEDRANFAVCAFSEEDCAVLLRGLEKFDIEAIYYKDSSGYSRLRLNADQAEKLFLLISPYVHPVMRYKLPERYRNGCYWLPSDEISYKQILVKQQITHNAKTEESSCGFFIQTETNNLFVNKILVGDSTVS